MCSAWGYVYKLVHFGGLFEVGEKSGEVRYPSVGGWINTQLCSWGMERYNAVRKDPGAVATWGKSALGCAVKWPGLGQWGVKFHFYVK